MTKNTNTIDILNAVFNNDIETIKTYINNGGDVNAKTECGNTALMLACDAEIAKLLLDAGADVNAKNQYGSTALMRAYNVKIAKLLLDAGADINAKNQWNETALMWAKNGPFKCEIAKLLESHGAVA